MHTETHSTPREYPSLEDPPMEDPTDGGIR